jgi:hypothetical protein
MDIITVPASHNGVLKKNQVYIGPHRGKLSRSFWYMPHILSLSLYREELEKWDLSWITDDIELLCVCNYWKKCHGHILLYLGMKKLNYNHSIVSYELDSSPFSNAFSFQFNYKGHVFDSLAHAYYWERSNCHESLLPSSLPLSMAAKKYNELMQKKERLSLRDNVKLLFYLLQQKHAQCEQFKKLLDEHKNDFILHNITHPFWGKGSGEMVYNCNGQNINGWLIMCLINDTLAQCRKKLIYVCEGEMNVSIARGLQFIGALLELE